MKHSPSSSSSTALFSQPLRKNGLRMILEPDIEASFGLEFGSGFGPIYTIDGLKAGTTNADVAARLQYVGDTVKWSAKHRKAAAARGTTGIGSKTRSQTQTPTSTQIADAVSRERDSSSSAASSAGSSEGSSRASSESG